MKIYASIAHGPFAPVDFFKAAGLLLVQACADLRHGIVPHLLGGRPQADHPDDYLAQATDPVDLEWRMQDREARAQRMSRLTRLF